MKVSLKKYLKVIIDLNDKHLRELMSQSEVFHNESLKIFKETNDIHLAHLNNTYNRAEGTVNEIAKKTVSTDEHIGFKQMCEKRFNDLEAVHLKEEGANKLVEKKETGNEKLYYFIAGAIVSIILLLIGIYLKP